MRYTCFYGLLLLLTSCSYYQNEPEPIMTESESFLVILVNARHLNYKDGQAFIKTMQRSPDFGHAWVLVKGRDNLFEGGHSGELGVRSARYFDGIMNNINYGCSNPAEREKRNPGYEPNPVKYLWEAQRDGYYQHGNGGHTPTYAIKVDLTDEQYRDIMAFISRYEFTNYSITGNQCSTFVAHIAEIAGLFLKDKVELSINQKIKVFGEEFVLWQDPVYSKIAFSSPDMLEIGMKEAVRSGKAEYALSWYFMANKFSKPAF